MRSPSEGLIATASPADTTSTERAAALTYAVRGWKVLPVRGKRPLTRHGVNDATTDASVIEGWFTVWRDAGVAIRTGDGVVVVDIDPRHGGHTTLAMLQEEYGELPPTATVTTGSGGRHFYFIGDARCGVLGRGVDLKGRGGCVVAPPSPGYEWECEGPLADLPAWVLISRKAPTPKIPDELPERIERGDRNRTLFAFARRMRAWGSGVAGIEAALLAINREQCAPPLPEREVRRIARSAASYEVLPPWKLHPAEFALSAGVSSTATVLLLAMSKNCGPNGVLDAPIARLCRWTGCSRTAVKDAIHELEVGGRIKVVRRHHKASLYRLVRPQPQPGLYLWWPDSDPLGETRGAR
jgi:hypothetical protein